MGNSVWTTVRVVICLVLLAMPVSARDLGDSVPRQDQIDVSLQARSNSPVPWPTCVAVHQTPEVVAECNQYGQLGPPRRPAQICTGSCGDLGLPCGSFESPPGSGIEYLFLGGIWIGGVIGSDTLVSVGLDGWLTDENFTPMMSPRDGKAGFRPMVSPADFAARVLLTDTVMGQNPGAPLNIEVAFRTLSWNAAVANKAILYDVVIRNMGNSLIKDGCVGVYVDADVGLPGIFEDYVDDLTGSLRSEGIAYVVDNDGNPGAFGFVPTSPRRLIAAKFLRSSKPLSDTTYNWWFSHFDGSLDYGPRLDDSLYRDFGTGGTGTPAGEKNKYYIMTKPEWDFDQIYTQHIDSLSQTWLSAPPSVAYDISNGSDSKFLLSVGTFDLAPDSSVRIVFCTFTGSDVHRDPEIMDFLPYFPDFYRWSLNFGDVLKVARAADSLAALVIDPQAPVVGLEVARHTPDSAFVRWDPQCFDNIYGYDICLSEVNPSRLPYPGVLAPWLHPESLVVFRSVGTHDRFVLDTLLNAERFYFVNVVSRSPAGPGQSGQPWIHRSLDQGPPPVPTNRYQFFADGDPVTLRWRAPDDMMVDHFNLYRLDSFGDTAELFHPFYDRGESLAERVPSDSIQVGDSVWYYFAMRPWQTVSGSASSFTLTNPTDSSCYVLTAVSPFGFESHFSSPMLLFSAPRRTKDVLVLTKSYASGFFGSPDSIAAFYDDLLAGVSYDLYKMADSAVRPSGWPWWIDLMPYRLVIIDDDLKDLVFRSAPLWAMRNYLNSGGEIMICGSLFEYSWSDFSSRTVGWFATDSIASGYLGIDSILTIGMRYYHDSTTPPYIDSLGGFIRAEALESSLPELAFDTTRNPFLPITTGYWPANTAPIVAAFAVDDADSVLYRYRSRYPGTSRMEGFPVGVRRRYGMGNLYAFGCHLWYLEREGVKELINALLDRIPTDIENAPSGSRPDQFTLYQNYPNPFNPVTTIAYSLTAAAQVRLEVFNLLGQRVAVLVNRFQTAGQYESVWNGRSETGAMAASGVYFYRLSVADQHRQGKMLLIK